MIRKSCDRCGKDMGAIKNVYPFVTAYRVTQPQYDAEIESTDPMNILNIWAGPSVEKMQILDLCDNCIIQLREFLGIQRRSLNNE